jgi:excisionase family DNA binding protein
MHQEYVQKLEARISELELTVCELKRLIQYQIPDSNKGRVDPHDQLLTVKEVAGLIGLPRQVIYDKAISGEIPSFKIGKRYKFSRKKVLEWFEWRFDKTAEIDEFVDKYLRANLLSG